ncbi:DMT family transporter [Streptomyces sp. BK340]|uniref:DMT family transporter n=1 Tax=Streptomyces sp. BK340 TaxID=2572903 RepID=UPI0011A3BF5C|nr:DMT family transporter [Streptomyces sp. BK340]TVZ84820.1 drug/metabolite transporter (DMT)-like permease [Streptomyces sp. BK340]
MTLSAIWGASFALIKVAVDAGVPPLWVACWRCVFGATALWAILVLRREPAPRDLATWGHSAVAAALLNAVPFVLFSYGETRVGSVLAGVMNATTPLFTLVFAAATVPEERHPGPRRLVGLALGFAGVLTVLGVWHGFGSKGTTGGLACLAATCCYGAGFAYLRLHLSARPHSATGLSAVQITCGGAELALVAPLAAGVPHWPGAGPATALLVLGSVGTGFAYILNLNLVRTAGATVAAAVTYVTPLWSTALGVVLFAEPVGWNTLLGGFTVVAAVALTRASTRPGSTSQGTSAGQSGDRMGNQADGSRGVVDFVSEQEADQHGRLTEIPVTKAEH